MHLLPVADHLGDVCCLGSRRDLPTTRHDRQSLPITGSTPADRSPRDHPHFSPLARRPCRVSIALDPRESIANEDRQVRENMGRCRGKSARDPGRRRCLFLLWFVASMCSCRSILWTSSSGGGAFHVHHVIECCLTVWFTASSARRNNLPLPYYPSYNNGSNILLKVCSLFTSQSVSQPGSVMKSPLRCIVCSSMIDICHGKALIRLTWN